VESYAQSLLWKKERRRKETERRRKEEFSNHLLCNRVYHAGFDVHFVLIKPNPGNNRPPK
jgi:hypothetical protein